MSDTISLKFLKEPLRSKVQRLGSEIRELQKGIEELETDKSAKSKQLQKLMEQHDILGTIKADNFSAIYTIQRKGSIVPSKLLDQGVGVEVIEAATVYKEVSYVQVRGTGEKKLNERSR